MKKTIKRSIIIAVVGLVCYALAPDDQLKIAVLTTSIVWVLILYAIKIADEL